MSKQQFSPLNPLLRFLRFQLLLASAVTPPSFHQFQRSVLLLAAAPGHLLSRTNAAAVCSSAPSTKLEVVFKKRRGGNPGTDQQRTGSGLSPARSSSAPRANVAGKSTIKTINITMILNCNTYSNIISQIFIRPVMCLKLF